MTTAAAGRPARSTRKAASSNTSSIMTNPMGTLIAYEWQRTKGAIGLIVLIAGALTLGGVLLSLLPWEPVKVLGALAAIVAASMLLPALALALAVDYWRRAYGREGYLTQALPVRGATQFAARVVYGALVLLGASIVTLVFGAGVMVVMGAIEMPDAGPAEIARTLWAASPFAEQPWWLAVAVLLCWVVAVAYLLQFYCAVSVGSESRWAFLKGAAPVVIWFGIYWASQLVLMVSVLAVPWGITFEAG